MLIFSRWSMCMAWCGGMVAAFDSRCWGIQSHQGILFLLVVFLYLIPFFLFVWYVFFSCFFLLLISILIWVVTCNGHGQFLIFLVLAWEFGSHDFGWQAVFDMQLFRIMCSTLFRGRHLCYSPPIDPATHSISATTPVLFWGIFWWVTPLNVSHWSKGVMHVVIFTINNDVALSDLFLSVHEYWTADWLIGQFRTFHRIFSWAIAKWY